MRTLGLLGLVLGLLAVATFASPWIAMAANGLGFAFKFSRVYNRVFEVLLIGAILLGWRRLDLGNATQIGLRHPRWARDLARGLLIGFLGVLAGVVACWLGGAMVPELRYGLAKTVGKAVAGLLGAVLVGVGEEALFRGVLLRRFTADLGRPGGVLLTTAIYAVRARAPARRLARGLPVGGIDRTLALFAPLADARASSPACSGSSASGCSSRAGAPAHRQPVVVHRHPRGLGGGLPGRAPGPRHPRRRRSG